jgi:hypothetical protein
LWDAVFAKALGVGWEWGGESQCYGINAVAILMRSSQRETVKDCLLLAKTMDDCTVWLTSHLALNYLSVTATPLLH